MTTQIFRQNFSSWDDPAGQNLPKSPRKPYFEQMLNGGPPRPTKIIVLIKTIQYGATFRLGLRTRIFERFVGTASRTQ